MYSMPPMPASVEGSHSMSISVPGENWGTIPSWGTVGDEASIVVDTMELALALPAASTAVTWVQ